jgi:RNA polymerase sigma-70 factor (ECF subfamily)
MPDSGSNKTADFAAFMSTWQDMVYSTAMRLLSDQAQAEDISQSVFLKAYERFDELRASATAPGWLKTVATNMSINHLQRYRKRLSFMGSRAKDDEDGEMPESAEFSIPDQNLDNVADDQRHLLVERVLRSLPEHQRVPLVLYHFEELSYQDIADRLKVSVAKVKTDIFRARAALTAKLASLSATTGLQTG